MEMRIPVTTVFYRRIRKSKRKQVMTSKEYTEYDRLTEDMEFDFIVLTSEFLLHCEHIIFGEDYPDLKYYCFHLYNDSYSSKIFQKLSYRIERLYKQKHSNEWFY